ncbi:hypothetical protein DVQ29_21945 [Yersinia enterocolitica]|nr:hypothetical protein [Yersinia enterocolitica]CRX55985.1 Uncharacterised protein [Yersinia enterocolitica]
MNIQLPQFSEEIVDRVLEKCEFLIEYKYWDTISETELHSWIENFETKEDRYLAAIILDSIIFRNKKSISTFGANIFQIIIPQFLSELKIYEIDSIESWEKSLRSPECRNLPIRFLPLKMSTATQPRVLLRYSEI